MHNNQTLRWLYAVPKRKKVYILILIFVQMLHGGSGVFYALLLRNIVDSAVAKEIQAFWWNVVMTVLLVLGQLALSAVVRFLSELSKSSLENIFKKRLMENLLVKDFASVEAIHSGEWLNRLTNDTVVVANGYTEILPGMAEMSVKMVSAVAMLIVLQPWFGWLLIPGGAMMAVLTYAFRKSMKKMHKNVQEKDGRLRIFLQETLGNMMMIRSFAAERQIGKEMQQKTAAHQQARMKKNRFANFCHIGFSVAIQGMYLFGVCWCGWGILTGSISYGTLTAVTQLISQIQTPFANLTGYLPKFYAMTASAERLMEVEDFAKESTLLPFSSSEITAFYRSRFQAIGLKDSSFRYYPPSENVTGLSKQAMPDVLEHIGLTIRKGEYVAFTGHSGCGKSTVLKLLMHIYRPDSGECFLATKEGQIPMTARWHRLFAYVPQGNKLMTGSVRDAVTFADRANRHDDARIQRALQIACAEEFVNELENGIDTLLGERGTGLSEGQMQRIAVARAIFSDSPILILDEATSSLDGDTEQRLLYHLRSMTDKTVILVTHRPAALAICDRILHFTEKGVEESTYPGK